MVNSVERASRYSFDNAWERASDRLAALEAWLDPGTQRHLEALGIRSGWRCLEVGAGRGSIAAWIAHRVAPAGHVLATDFDPRFLLTIRLPNLEAQQHDIVRDGLPRSSFDLIHMRLLLAHVLQREFALDKMIAALKPGGWILAEEMDFTAMAAEPTVDAERGRLFDRLAEAHRRVTSARGFDQFFGRRLFSPTDGGCLGPPPARWLSKLPGQAAAERR